MPVILLSVDANTGGATAGITQVVGNLTTMQAAIQRATDTTATFDSALARATASMDAWNSMLTRAAGYLDALETALSTTADAVSGFGLSLDRSATSLQTFLALSSELGGSLDGQIGKFGAVATAIDATTVSLRAQAAAYDLLATAQRSTGTASVLGSVGGVGRTVAQDETTGLERGGAVLARTGAADIGGVAGSAGLAALGPGALVGSALAAIMAGYAGYKVSGIASGFQSAEAQTGAQMGSPAKAAIAAQDILTYTGSGKSPFDATALMKDIEPLLAHGYSPGTYSTGIKTVAELSGQNAAPDISNAVNAVNQYLALLGSGAKSTAAQMVQAGDYFSQMEKMTTIKPGQLTPAMTNVMTSAIGTGITPDQLAAGFIKIGTANANAGQDSTTYGRLIQELLVKNTPGAQAEAQKLGLAMGPGALNAYGGSLEAMIQAYANATAGPNQAADIAKLFPTSGVRGGATAFKELTAGGGTQQALGYETLLGKDSGAGQSAYAQYSVGIQQQETQLASQFNSDMVQLGWTINQYVIPALLGMAKGALGGTQDVTKGITATKSWLDQHVPGGTGTVLAAASIPFTGPLAVMGDTMKGIYDHSTAVRNGISTVGGVAGSFGNSIGSGFTNGDSVIGSRTDLGNDFVRHLGSLKGGTGEQGTLDTGMGNDYVRHLGSLKGGTGDQGFGSQLPVATGAVTALGSIARITTDAFTTLGNGIGGIHPNFLQPSSNYDSVRDRSAINSLLTAGAGPAQLNTQLAQLKADLPNSLYTSAQQQGILGTESFKVHAYEAGPADQAAISAAQMNLDAAQQMGDMPPQLKQYQDQYLQAQRTFYQDTEKGTTLAASLKGVSQQGAVYAASNQQVDLARGQKNLQNQIDIDKLTGNSTAQLQAEQALLAYQTGHAGVLKLDSSDLSLLAAQARQDLIATYPVKNINAFFDKQQGLGPFEAGDGATLVRGGGNMAANTTTTEIRMLRQELSASQAMNTQLLQQIARNTGVKAQAAAKPGSHSGRNNTSP